MKRHYQQPPEKIIGFYCLIVDKPEADKLKTERPASSRQRQRKLDLRSFILSLVKKEEPDQDRPRSWL